MIPKLLALLAFGLAVCCSPLAGAESDTNAARFARGLPPLRPRTLFDASKVITAPHAKRSMGPSFDCTDYTTTDLFGNTQIANYAYCCTGSYPDFFAGVDGTGCVDSYGHTSTGCDDGSLPFCCFNLYSAINCAPYGSE